MNAKLLSAVMMSHVLLARPETKYTWGSTRMHQIRHNKRKAHDSFIRRSKYNNSIEPSPGLNHIQ